MTFAFIILFSSLIKLIRRAHQAIKLIHYNFSSYQHKFASYDASLLVVISSNFFPQYKFVPSVKCNRKNYIFLVFFGDLFSDSIKDNGHTQHRLFYFYILCVQKSQVFVFARSVCNSLKNFELIFFAQFFSGPQLDSIFRVY